MMRLECSFGSRTASSSIAAVAIMRFERSVHAPDSSCRVITNSSALMVATQKLSPNAPV